MRSVSLVVLNWNGRAHLETNLRSLTQLDYPEAKLEIIVVDNGSDDGSVGLVRRDFPEVRLIELEANRGFAAPNNLAAAEAQGDWLGFLNNDMRLDPSWLRDMVSVLDDHPQAACLGSRIKTWDGSRLEFVGGGVGFSGHGFQVGLDQAESGSDVERPVLFACGGAMLVRHQVYEELGGFDPDYFAYYEDVDLGWRLNILGHDVWYSPRATVYHRHHSTGARLPYVKLRVLYERNALFTIYKCLDDANLAAALPAAMLLLNERALIMAGIDPADYRLGPAPAGPSLEGLDASQPQRLYAFDPAGALPEGLARRAARVLAREGLRPALGKTRRYLRDRGQAAARRAVKLPGTTSIPEVATSHYVALSDFARSLEGIQAKRAAVQGRRRRSDAELIPLMVDPFFVNYQHPRYLRFHSWLAGTLGLDRRFGKARD